MKSDGVLTPAERKQLHAALSEASRAIFGLKHNAAHRPRGAIVQLIDDAEFTEDEAKELVAQVLRLLEIRRLLAGPALPPERRQALEEEFAALASQLFE